MRKSGITSPAAGLIFILALTAAPSRAEKTNVDCRDAQVFSDAAVNILILPYSYAPSAETRIADTSRRLSTLLQMNTLFAAVKYGSVGVVQLVDRSDGRQPCDAAVVVPRIKTQMGAGRAAVLLSGNIYQEGDRIFLRSYIRFFRKPTDAGKSDSLDLTIQVPGWTASAELPAYSVAFAPVELTASLITKIAEEFRRSAMIFDKPEGATGQQLPGTEPGDTEQYSYRVVETQGDWIHIERSKGSSGSGWIRARIGLELAPITDWMPELNFLEGVSGFVRLRVARDGIDPGVPELTASAAENALKRFQDKTSADTAPLALAASKAMTGIIHFYEGDYVNALRLFDDAVSLAPFSGDARNLAALSRIYLSYRGGLVADWKRISDDLVDAVQVDPRNQHALDNLANFYQLLLTTGPPHGQSLGPIDRQVLKDRLGVVSRLRGSPVASQ